VSSPIKEENKAKKASG